MEENRMYMCEEFTKFNYFNDSMRLFLTFHIIGWAFLIFFSPWVIFLKYEQ